jgi:hypothetical protein
VYNYTPFNLGAAVAQYSGQATGWMSWVRFPAGSEGICSLRYRIQTGSVDHPSSYPVGTSGSFSGRKVAEAGVELTTHLQLVSRLRMLGAIPPFPYTPSWRSA